jgi:hypothetical protein
MEWHIITASKGGVGKTLTTLLLLAYYLEEEPDTSTLVVDLNAMNTDTSSMLLGKGENVNEPVTIDLKTRKMWLQTTADSRLMVAYSRDPFAVYARSQFADLITSIREKIDNKGIVALNNKPLDRVIVDTNYHFCNLFPPQDENYKHPQWQKLIDMLREDDLNVWFLWVYRQLQKILGKKSDEITIVKRTASAMERMFPPKENKLGPLIHTYTPVGLLPTDSENIGILARLFGSNYPNFNEDYTVPNLKKLESLPNVGKYIFFTSWLQQMLKHNGVLDKKSVDIHQLFGKLLYESVRNEKEELPINIFPISLYEATLMGYTDKERDNIVTGLQNLDTYKNFKKLLRRKLGHS